MKKLFFIVVSLIPLVAIEQINIKFNKTNTMCKVVNKQNFINLEKCESIAVFKDKLYCILKDNNDTNSVLQSK